MALMLYLIMAHAQKRLSKALYQVQLLIKLIVPIIFKAQAAQNLSQSLKQPRKHQTPLPQEKANLHSDKILSFKFRILLLVLGLWGILGKVTLGIGNSWQTEGPENY